MSEPFLGELRCVGFNFANRGWANCDGQILPIAQNTALFSLFGTMYGGDGRTTFGLPGLRGRVPVHVGQGPGLPDYRQGAKSGQTTVTLNDTQIPSHNHNLFNGDAGNFGQAHVAIAIANVNADASLGTGNALARRTTDDDGSGSAGDQIYTSETPAVALHASSGIISGATAFNGGSQDHNNMQPYQALRWLVALAGVYPSRD